MKQLEGTAPNSLGMALLRVCRLPASCRYFTLRLYPSLVLRADGHKRTVWKNWRVIAGPTVCVVTYTVSH